jgi:hypothetical protein
MCLRYSLGWNSGRVKTHGTERTTRCEPKHHNARKVARTPTKDDPKKDTARLRTISPAQRNLPSSSASPRFTLPAKRRKKLLRVSRRFLGSPLLTCSVKDVFHVYLAPRAKAIQTSTKPYGIWLRGFFTCSLQRPFMDSFPRPFRLVGACPPRPFFYACSCPSLPQVFRTNPKRTKHFKPSFSQLITRCTQQSNSAKQ